MPFFSIIIPVFNKEKYLDKCIQSIVSQTFTDWEIILINDGSSDNSPSICEQWSKKDKRIKTIHQHNMGVSAARNKGILIAEGQYIQFTDADDWWIFNSFQSIYDENKFLSNPDLLIFGITKMYYNNKNIITKPLKLGVYTNEKSLENMIGEQLDSGIYGMVANKIIKRSILIEHSIRFDTTYSRMEDYNFYIDVMKVCSRVGYSHFCGYIYLQNADNSTSHANFKTNYLHLIAIHIKAYNLQKESVPIENHEIESLRTTISLLIVSMYAENEYISSSGFRQLASQYKKLLPSELFSIQHCCNSLNFKIISILVKREAFYLLSLYLNIRKFIKRKKYAL